MSDTTAKRGGVRKGAGRPRVQGNPTMKSVKLSREHWEKAKKIGSGNMAEGIRKALDSYSTQQNNQTGERA